MLLATPLLLSACSRAETSNNSNEDLASQVPSIRAVEARLNELETRVDELEDEATTVATDDAAGYMLAGSGALEVEGKRFLNRHECESEKRALLDRARIQSERARERGVVLTTEPLVSCIALIGD